MATNSTESCDLDPLAVRKQFARRAVTLQRADFLLRESERRMLERLDTVRLQPQSMLDVGCGQGHSLARLVQRYPQAHAMGCDLAWQMAAQAHRTLTPAARGMFARLARRTPAPLATIFAADARALPLASSSIDLIWSNLAFHWFTDPRGAVDEWQRIIRPNGLVSFTVLGVDSLRELRHAGARMMVFPDMHDIGDLLGHAGFAEPVMDVERLTLTYRDPQALLADAHAIGANALRNRFRGLLGRNQRDEWLRTIDQGRDADGLLRLSIELIFGQAWCPAEKRLPEGLARIRIMPRRQG